MSTMPWRSLRALSAMLAAPRLEVTVEGLEHVPAAGPAIITARHYHHLYDGVVLLATIHRPLQILVASDWAPPGPRRRLLEAACRAAGWPTVQRAGSGRPDHPARAAGDRRHLLQAVRQSVNLLASGRLLLIFPEGYPTIDPGYTPKTAPDEFLPFEPGFARIAALTARRTGSPVPVVPAGFHYHQAGERWQVALRFGEPILVTSSTGTEQVVHLTEQGVRFLSWAIPE